VIGALEELRATFTAVCAVAIRRPSCQLIQKREAAIRPLPERHALAFALQGFDAASAEALSDRVEDPADRHVVLIGRPRLRVLFPGVDRHVAAVESP
jgi:hypothetical protein